MYIRINWKVLQTQIARTNPQCFWLSRSGMSLKVSFSNNFPGDTDAASQKYLRISVLCLLKRWHFVMLLDVVDLLSSGYALKSDTHIFKLSTSIVIYSLNLISNVSFSSVQLLNLCDPMNCSTPGLPIHHQLLQFTQTQSIELVKPYNHLILCCPLLLLRPSIFPSIRVFSNDSVLCIR